MYPVTLRDLLDAALFGTPILISLFSVADMQNFRYLKIKSLLSRSSLKISLQKGAGKIIPVEQAGVSPLQFRLEDHLLTIADILLKALERRASLHTNPDTDCYRLFHLGGDGIEGLTIDRYGSYILIQFFETELFSRLEEIRGVLPGVLKAAGLPFRGILLKDRTRISSAQIAELRKSRLLTGEEPPAGYICMQNGIRAAVDLREGQNTGLFLDMRQIRERLAPYLRETPRLLNLFCYTSLFSVFALKNGCRRAINIDLSKSALQRSRENYALNGLPVDERDFVQGDVKEWLKILRKKGECFSLVIYDPPTFSRHQKRTFSVKRDYPMHLSVISEIAAGGYALSAVNSHSLSKEMYLSFHPPGWKPVFLASESDDFPSGDHPYLKAGLWKIPDGQ